MTEMTEAHEWQGRTIIGSDGEKIGKISEIYLDSETDKLEWATVTSGLFGTKSHFLPLIGAFSDGEDVRAQVTSEQIKDAPNVDPGGVLAEYEETRLFEHYGIPYTQEGSVSAQGQPGGARGMQADRSDVDQDTSGSTTDDAMTRSEEELHVVTRQRESGRVRLRKYVVIEMVTKTVPVQREEVRIEREPITDANRDQAMAGTEISEGEHEMILHEDEVVVDKTVVPNER